MSTTPVLVEKRARIFRFGHYPAKRWGITRDEFIQANGSTGTIPIGIDPIGKGHYVGRESWLDGETGEAVFSVEGDEVLATLRLPELLERVVTKVGAKISAVFHPTDKTLTKIDLVQAPHIADAIIFAEEQGTVLVFEDDEPESEPEEVAFCEQQTREFAQQIHELAASFHPGLCDPEIDPWEKTEEGRLIRIIHDFCVQEGKAECPGMTPEDEDEDEDEEAIAMADETEEETTEQIHHLEPASVSFENSPVFVEMQKQLNRLATELIEKDAVAFADSMTKGNEARANPAERNHIIGLYRRAALDDARLPEVITFAEGTTEVQGTRVQALKASYAVRARQVHRDAKTFTLDEEPPTGKASDEDQKAEREKRRQQNQAYAARYNPPQAR